MESLEKLLYLAGVSSEYLDYAGNHRLVPPEDRVRALRAAGHPVDDPEALAATVFELDAAPWQRRLRPLYITAAGRAEIAFHCHPGQLVEELEWELATEAGPVLRGRVRPGDCPEVGDYVIGNTRYSARRLELPPVDIGYHQLAVQSGSQREHATVVVCPDRCYDLAVVEGRQWGISCQLYTLRSHRNWGVGDFSDLQELIALAAAAGADMIGLNPLHAPCSGSPDAASPYSPSDRRFLNPVYVDVEMVARHQGGVHAAALLADAGIQGEVAQLRASPVVDYDAVHRLKYRLFQALFADFREQRFDRCALPWREYREFVAGRGETLHVFAEFERGHNPYGGEWRDDPDFYRYLQWLAAEQLGECQRLAARLGMRIGLVGDLAVGAVPAGCEVQSNPGIFRTGATIGAPPDPFADGGQDWGLPVVDPLGLRRDRYHHFISLLRANMAAAGALRIDHVMSLLRLWWCLPASDEAAHSGVYVYYPLQDLIALVRLESCRNRCLVIGEDLGVVPWEIREEMQASGVYGNTLLYFEQWHDRRFRRPADQRPDALLMVTNHDVPTLADWWGGGDLRRRRALGLVPDDAALAAALAARDRDRRALLDWLADCGCLPPGRDTDPGGGELDFALCTAIHRACASSASRLMLLQLEDLQLMTAPVNIPGTYREYPNWRRKQVATTSEIFARAEVRQLLGVVNEVRRREQSR